MKVYVLTEEWIYDGFRIEGVTTNLEKAEKWENSGDDRWFYDCELE